MALVRNLGSLEWLKYADIPGILNTWKWPEIEGLHDFKGPLMHSAKWDHSVDFDDKVAGVIGTGSTSVQIVPQLQKICKQVQVYMRSPTWISPPFGAGTLANDLQNGKWLLSVRFENTASDIQQAQRLIQASGSTLSANRRRNASQMTPSIT